MAIYKMCHLLYNHALTLQVNNFFLNQCNIVIFITKPIYDILSRLSREVMTTLELSLSFVRTLSFWEYVARKAPYEVNILIIVSRTLSFFCCCFCTMKYKKRHDMPTRDYITQSKCIRKERVENKSKQCYRSESQDIAGSQMIIL